MAQGNRNMTAKFERAQRERRDYAKGMAALEATRPGHLAKAAPIVATHWGLRPEPVTKEEQARLVAEYHVRKAAKAAEIAAAKVEARNVRNLILFGAERPGLAKYRRA
jgi:hypothetical protein